MTLKPSIAIVGYGNVGRALTAALKREGYVVDEVVRRDSKPRLAADVIWFCVPDQQIAAVSQSLTHATEWRGKIAVHSSGALPASELAPVKRRGASIASAHPLNTFVPASKNELIDVPFALEGEVRALRVLKPIITAMNGGGPVFNVEPAHKPLYHAMGAFASPLLISLLANAEVVGRAAGLKDPRRALAKILETTIANYMRNGAAASFSGPIIRGDEATVRKHLAALQKLPRQRAVYKALAESAIQLLPSKLKKI